MTVTDKSEYIGAGAGTPRPNRGDRHQTSYVSHLLRDDSASRKLRTFSTKHQQHGYAPRRASSVLLLGFSVPLLATAGGALFCRPGRSSTEGKTEGRRRQMLENSRKRGREGAGGASVSFAKHPDWTIVAIGKGGCLRLLPRVGTRALPANSIHPIIYGQCNGSAIGCMPVPHEYRGRRPRPFRRTFAANMPCRPAPAALHATMVRISQDASHPWTRSRT